MIFTADIDITSSMVHAGKVLPFLSYRVVATCFITIFITIETTIHVN
jgi:hypothetical protein